MWYFGGVRRNYLLTQKFPFLVRIFRSITPKLLDFTDFPKYKSSVNLLLRERDFKLKYVSKSFEIDQWNLAILDLLSDKSIPSIKVERIGSFNDGGYFVPVEYCNSTNWITIGLGSNIDFENELASRKCNVISFDHTTPGRPRNLNSGVVYMPLGWGSTNKKQKSTLISLTTMLTLAKDMDSFSDHWNLKFDIEGNEWKCLDQITKLKNKPAIIVCELHFLIWNEIQDDKFNLLSELLSFYKICFIKGNNYSQYFFTPEYGIYDIIEITLIRNDLVGTLSYSDEHLGSNQQKNNRLVIQMPIGRISQWKVS